MNQLRSVEYVPCHRVFCGWYPFVRFSSEYIEVNHVNFILVQDSKWNLKWQCKESCDSELNDMDSGLYVAMWP